MKTARSVLALGASIFLAASLLAANLPAQATTISQANHAVEFQNAAQINKICSSVKGLYKYSGTGQPANGAYVPIVLIHGFSAKGESWDGNVNMFDNPAEETDWDSSQNLPRILHAIPGAAVFGFQYYNNSFNWITNKNIGPQLVKALTCLKQATGQKAIIIVHSMGGLATHYAVNNGAGDAVSRVITYATPNTGSRLAAKGAQIVSGIVDAATGGMTEHIFNDLLTNCGKTPTGACAQSKALYASALDPKTQAMTALAYGSDQIKELEQKWPWPSNIPVNAYGGNVNLNILGTGIFKWYDADLKAQPVGDEIVSPDSAKAGSTTYMQVNCNMRADYHLTSNWETGQEQTGLLPQIYNEDFKKFDQAGASNNGWTPTEEEKNRKYAIWNSACLHTNITHNAGVVNDSLFYVKRQVEKQAMQFSTYDASNPSDTSKWTIGYDGVGPYKVGMTNAQRQQVSISLAKTGEVPNLDRQDMKKTIDFAYQTGNNLVNETGWAGIQNGRMLVCRDLSATDNGVRGMVYTPIQNAKNADAYIKTADPYNKSTLDEIWIGTGQTSPIPAMKTPTGIGYGTTLDTLINLYGKQKLLNVDAAFGGEKIRVYQLQNPSNPGYWDDLAARSEDENYSSINFFLDEDNKVDAISIGKLIPRALGYGECRGETHQDSDNQFTATYDKSNPGDYSQWTVGNNGFGPYKLGNLTADGVTKINGIDYKSVIKNAASFSHAMSKGSDDPNFWGGMPTCRAASKDGHIILSIAPPVGHAKTYDEYAAKTNPYAKTPVTGFYATSDSEYASNNASKAYGGELPKTNQGLGIGSAARELIKEYPADRTTVSIDADGYGTVTVFPNAAIKNQWAQMGEGGPKIDPFYAIYFDVEFDVIKTIGVAQYGMRGCSN